jgi:hypothetical protein
VCAAPCAASVARIGYLSALDPARESTRSEAIRLAVRELGYIEGQNIAIEYRYAEGKLDRIPELAAELVRLKVNSELSDKQHADIFQAPILREDTAQDSLRALRGSTPRIDILGDHQGD